MNKESMIKITEPEVVSKIESIENGATGVIIYNYDKSHVYYKGIDLGSFEELLNVKKYITDLQKKAELGDHYKHLYSEVKKQKENKQLQQENQQKEFIKYMNGTIEDIETENVDDEEMKGYLIQRIYTFKEILQKYKEIIGSDSNE